jgi:hypothetical protein
VDFIIPARPRRQRGAGRNGSHFLAPAGILDEAKYHYVAGIGVVFLLINIAS